MPTGKLLIALTALLSCGLIAAGCGGDDDGDGGNGDGGTVEATTTDEAGETGTTDIDVPTTEEEAREAVDELIEQCREQAEQIPEGNLRDQALEACEQGEAEAEEQFGE